jgi:hypothetical protein
MPTINTFQDFASIPELNAPWTKAENYAKSGLIVGADGKAVDPSSEEPKYVIIEKRGRTYDPVARAARVAEGLKPHSSERVAIPLALVPGPDFVHAGKTFRLDVTSPTLPWVQLEEENIAFFTVRREGQECMIPIFAKNIGTVDAPNYVYNVVERNPNEALFQYILHAPHTEGESNLCRLLDMRPSPITDVKAFTEYLCTPCAQTGGYRIAILDHKEDVKRTLQLREEHCKHLPILNPDRKGETLLTHWVGGADHRPDERYFSFSEVISRADRPSLALYPFQLDRALEDALDNEGHSALTGVFSAAASVNRGLPDELIYRVLSETNKYINLNHLRDTTVLQNPETFVRFMFENDPQTHLPRILNVQSEAHVKEILEMAIQHNITLPVRRRGRHESCLLVKWAGNEPSYGTHEKFMQLIFRIEGEHLRANPHLVQKAFNITTNNWDDLWRNGGAIQDFARKKKMKIVVGDFYAKLRAEEPDAWVAKK